MDREIEIESRQLARLGASLSDDGRDQRVMALDDRLEARPPRPTDTKAGRPMTSGRQSARTKCDYMCVAFKTMASKRGFGALAERKG